MPRQRRSAPARPAVAPKRPSAPTQQQPNRPSSTAAYPSAAGQKAGPPAQSGQQQGSGLFGQMVMLYPELLNPTEPSRQNPEQLHRGVDIFEPKFDHQIYHDSDMLTLKQLGFYCRVSC